MQVRDFATNVLLAFSTETETVIDYIFVPEDAQVATYFSFLAAKLDLRDFSFCGFFAHHQLLESQALNFFDELGIEYLIKVHPFLVKYPTKRNWALDLAKPLYEQIQPLVFHNQVLITAHALTKEEFDSGKYKVNPDLTWLDQPVRELTDSRPDLQQKPFCYIFSRHEFVDTNLQKSWQEYLDIVEAVDKTNAYEVTELKNNPYFKYDGDKLVLNYRDLCVLTRCLHITNVGRGNFIPTKGEQNVPSAAQTFLELGNRYYWGLLHPVFEIDQKRFERVAARSGFTDKTLTYDVTKELFPQFFYVHLVIQNYCGKKAYHDLLDQVTLNVEDFFDLGLG